MRFQAWTMSCLAVWTVLVGGLSPAESLAEPSTQLYIGHAARLTALMPNEWMVDPVGNFDYAGPDGFVASLALPGRSLADACGTLAAPPYFDHATVAVRADWPGGLTCRLRGQLAGADASAVVMAHPYPFQYSNERYAYAAVIADPAHLDAIAATIDISPDRVTPEAYVTSVLDLVEARAYWTDDVDWPLIRREVLDDIELVPSMEMAQSAVPTMLAHLQAAGDNHSQVRLASDNVVRDDASGFGMLVGGRRVLAVYPDGPAARAGIRAGDLIESIDGQPFVPVPTPVDPARGPNRPAGEIANVTVQRPGESATITVPVEQGAYRLYLPPTGHRLPGDIGLIVVPHFLSPGRETDYAAAANHILASVDQPATCGWVVDLRLDGGGSYSPMITAVGPILGNGIFFGMRTHHGREAMAAYQDGHIIHNGREIANYLSDETYALQHLEPPVAVLIGPRTASSGEVATLAFIGRDDTRLFGEPTAGLTTGVQTYPLFDGLVIGLAVTAMMNRTGKTYPMGIYPNVSVVTDWTSYGTDDDPVVQAASEWLSQQPACANRNG